MEQNQEQRNKPMHILSTNFQQGHQEYKMGKGWIVSMVLGKLDIHVQKNKFGPLYHTIHKIQLKMD